MIDKYLFKIEQSLKYIINTQKSSIIEAADMIANSIIYRENAVIHVFGCGHSHIIAEELFYRAGGLACINPILSSEIMLHEGALKSSEMEKLNGLGSIILNRYDIKSGECIIIASHSGRNSVPIDVAIEAKNKGLNVIAITCIEYTQKVGSRHPSGKFLVDFADVVIDNGGMYGDASLNVNLGENQISFAPLSTILNVAIVNMIMIEVIDKIIKEGIVPPIFLSGNIDGSVENNLKLIKKYKSRIIGF